MPVTKIVTLYEHEKVQFKELGLSERDIESIKRINKFFVKHRSKSASNDSEEEEKLDEDDGFVIIYRDKLAAKRYVGFASFGGVTVQVLPKVFKPSKNKKTGTNQALLAFLRMLNRAYDLKIREVDLARLGKKDTPDSLLEVFVYLFAKTLLEEVQRGYYRDYIETQREEVFLRGRLLLTKQLRKPLHKQNRFSVELQEFSKDNLLNQIFYAATLAALKATSWRVNKKLLSELMSVFSDITIRRILPSDFERVHFTRLNERFKKAFTLAKLILSSFGGVYKDEAVGFFVKMDDLFERFILREIQRVLPEYEVEFQHSREFFRIGDEMIVHQRVDFIVFMNGIPLAILDAKYRNVSGGSHKADIMRQMYVYSTLFGLRSKVPLIVILPKSRQYNQDIGSSEEGEFFDSKGLTFLTYDLEKLATGQRDEEFSKKLREIISEEAKYVSEHLFTIHLESPVIPLYHGENFLVWTVSSSLSFDILYPYHPLYFPPQGF